MHRFRAVSVLFLLLLFLFSGTIRAQDTVSPVSYYTGMESLVSLVPVPREVSWYLPFKGTTQEKSLMLEIVKSGSYARKISIPLENDGSFDYVILMKDGPGVYTVTVFGSARSRSLSFEGVCYYTVNVKESVPGTFTGIYLNSKVLDFVNSSMGKTVGRGECWDLAQEALDMYGADWTRPLKFGIHLDPQKDEIKAGDIIQFRSVVLTEKLSDGRTRWEHYGAPDHTAVIYRVIGTNHYELAHQNTDNKRYVIKSEIDLNKKTSGAFYIYRPVVILIKANEFKP